MNNPLFQGSSVRSNRIIYTPSDFAKNYLLHLQEVGELTAIRSHTSRREGLISYLFFIVTDGEGTLDYDGKEYSLNSGDCVFINCRKSYAHTSSPDKLWTLKWVHFFGASMSGIYQKYIERGGSPVITPQCLTPYSYLISDILSVAGSDDHIRDMRINERLSSLLTLIMAESWHPEASPRVGLKKQSLQNVKQFLDEHYMERITLDMLAEKFYINKFYLTRVFKEQFGTTILSYLDHVRITHAKQLLRFTDMTSEQVGAEIGINEPGYFNRFFKKIEGVTPGEYRKLW